MESAFFFILAAVCSFLASTMPFNFPAISIDLLFTDFACFIRDSPFNLVALAASSLSNFLNPS